MFDGLGAPALLGLPFQDIAADPPIEPHQLAVHRQGGALLGRVDTGLQLPQPVGVAGRDDGEGGGDAGLLTHASSPKATASSMPGGNRMSRFSTGSLPEMRRGRRRSRVEISFSNAWMNNKIC